jgi:hypothetical protein
MPATPPRRLLPIAIAFLVAGAAVAQDGAITAVATDGSGRLTMCRSWVLFRTCRDYNNVPLPNRIALGDRLPLKFGSNPKTYEFPVERIMRQGGSCIVSTEAAGPLEDGNQLTISSCRRVSGAP